ncbi:MAG: mandelate racemase/muconate lactonizing enzyme family protein [Anaerolineae bacterium]|jgi:glucarate dehydratase
MRITAIRATPVNIPLEVPFFWSVGTYPGTTKVVIEVVTDEGLVGLGEAPSPSCAPVVTDVMAPRLIGADAFDLEACERLCVPDAKADANTADRSAVRAFGGIEMALWDLRGKAWEQPLYMLLGGAVRKEISFTEYFAYRQQRGDLGGESTPAEVAAYCARMRELHGSTCFEGKCPPGDPQATIEVVREVRRAVGDDAMVRLDANMGFSLTAARRVLAGIEPYDVDNFEDPVATFYEMAKLRQHSRIPFSSHVPDLRLAVRLGVPDSFVLNLTQLGGISRTHKFVAACEEMDVDTWFYSGDSGIASAAYLHVVAATQHIHRPSQSLFRWQTDDVTEEGPFKPESNVLPVPEEPGLGVTLSPSGLDRCHRRFIEEGPYDEFHNPTHPGKYARLPLC